MLAASERDDPEQGLVPGLALRHPQRPGPSAPGREELMDGMAALDLLPAEAVRPATAPSFLLDQSDGQAGNTLLPAQGHPAPLPVSP